MAPTLKQLPHRELFIGGRWVAPRPLGADGAQPDDAAASIPVISPATGAVIGHIAAATKADVDAAVSAAAAAHESGVWSRAGGRHRASVLRELAAKIRAAAPELAAIMSQEMGKPIREATYETGMAASCFEYNAGLAEELEAHECKPIDTGSAAFKASVRQEPIGVIAAITPWNFPLAVATWKVAPALAAGCCVVLKPSELASVAILELAELASQAGVPDGVFNVVTGLAEAGAALSGHPGVDLVTFTGSGATGRRVAVAAAANLKPSVLELGGKSPMVVFEDADLDKVAEWAMFGVFWNAGQVCSATSRLIVQDSVADALVSKLKARAATLKAGDPLDDTVTLGPVASAAQHKRVTGFIQAAQDEGAVLEFGGGRPADCPDGGLFVAPTVFSHVARNSAVWREEVFGPVLAVTTFASEQEAIDAANDTQFGLAGAVMSRDEARCRRVSEALRVGTAWVNCCEALFDQTPWGGTRASGYGRELGTWGLANCLAPKTVTEYVAPAPWPWYLA